MEHYKISMKPQFLAIALPPIITYLLKCFDYVDCRYIKPDHEDSIALFLWLNRAFSLCKHQELTASHIKMFHEEMFLKMQILLHSSEQL